MRVKLTTCVSIALVLGTMACGAAAAQGYEGPFWSVGESEIKENSTIKSKSVSTLTFEDSKAFGISCTVSMEGTVGVEGKGEIKSATASGCKNAKSCSEPETAKAVHLPWKTELHEVGGIPEESILNSGSGAPGWALECTVAGIKGKDECTGEAAAEIENVSNGTNLLFQSSLEHVNCTVGGSNTGTVTGTELDENPEGKLLEAVLFRLMVTASGTRKEPANGTSTCEYTLKLENCTVEFQNNSTVPVTIITKELKGAEATTRYGLPTVTCTVNLQLAARGGKCYDIVRLLINPTPMWSNFLTLVTRDIPFTTHPTGEAYLLTY